MVFETKADAEALLVATPTDHADISHYYHWREPFELDAVEAAIVAAGHSVVRIGTPQTMATELARWQRDVDLIFNLSVGFVDRFRLAAGPMLFELAGLPYSGADPYTKLISQNKHLLKTQFNQMGIPTPRFLVAPVGERPPEQSVPGYPCIVKPTAEGSSVGVWPDSVVDSYDELIPAVERLWNRLGMDALIEVFIAGRELKIVLLGDQEIAFEGIIEDVDAAGASLGDRILHFDVKSTGIMGKRAVATDEPMMTALLVDCRRIYRRFLPVDYASFDVRIAGDEYFFLEFQADATLHPERTLARCCELNGLSHERAVQCILSTALARHGLR